MTAAQSGPAGVPVLSICLPVFNEAAILPALLDGLQHVITALNVTTEVIFVDDGSADDTVALLEQRRVTFPELRVVLLSRNFGQQQACAAALEAASGQAVVIMDSDLQDPPELIPELFAKWQDGYEVVYAQRRRRSEPVHRRVAFWLFHRLFRLAAGISAPVDVGTFCLMDRRVASLLALLREQHRYLPGLRAWAGFRQASIQFDRPDRPDSRPKVGFWQLVRLGVDGIVSFSMWPLRVASATGLLLAAASTVFGIVVVAVRLLGFQLGQPGWTSIILLNALLGGMILVCLGIIGEYIGRIYEETKQRPYYIVRDRRGFGAYPGQDKPTAATQSERL